MPTVQREMTNSIHSSRLIVAAALVVLAVAIAIAFAPGAGARATKTSEVDVFGSGTIVWRQVAALAKPSPGATRVAILVPDQHSGSPERAHRLGPGGSARTAAGRKARRHLPRGEEVRVLGR